MAVDARSLLEGDLHGRETYERVESLVPDEIVAAVSVDCGDVFSPRGVDLVWRVSQALESIPGSLGVKSLTHAVRPVRRGFLFEMEPMVSRYPDEGELRQFREFGMGHPLVRNVMVSGDGRHALVLASFPMADGGQPWGQAGLCEDLRHALDPFLEEGVEMQVLALPCVGEELLGLATQQGMIFGVVVAGLVLGLLLAYFRSLVVVALIGIGGVVPLVLMLVSGLAAGWQMDPYVLLLFPLLGAVHLELQTHCYDAWQRNGLGRVGMREALRGGLDEVFRPALFALLTTGIGLLSLTTSEVGSVRAFGLWGACGVLMLFLSTFGPVLALLLILPVRWVGSGPNERGVVLGKLVGYLVRVRFRRSGWAALGVVGLIVGGVGLSWLRTDVRMLEFLGPDTRTRRAVEFFDQEYGGINILMVEADSGTRGGANSMGFLQYLENVSRYAQDQPEVTAVYSYDQVMAMANEIWEGAVPGSFRLPQDSRRVAMFVAAMAGFRLPLLDTLVDRDFRRAFWIVRTKDMSSEHYLALVDQILAEADRTRPEGVVLSAESGLHAILESDRRILRSQLWSGLGSILAIGLSLLILWRSPLLVAMALLATVVPVGLAMASLGYGGVPLNSITVMVGAVCLGIAVDQSVHFLSHWREGMGGGLSRIEALQRSLDYKSGPVTLSTLVLVGVFSAMLVFSFPPVAAFGAVAALAFLLTWICVLVLLPAWIHRT
jgi:predicted RND superfamily exporter protein